MLPYTKGKLRRGNPRIRWQGRVYNTDIQNNTVIRKKCMNVWTTLTTKVRRLNITDTACTLNKSREVPNQTVMANRSVRYRSQLTTRQKMRGGSSARRAPQLPV